MRMLDISHPREDTDLFTRQWGRLRPFDMNITDREGQEAIHLTRPCKLDHNPGNLKLMLYYLLLVVRAAVVSVVCRRWMSAVLQGLSSARLNSCGASSPSLSSRIRYDQDKPEMASLIVMIQLGQAVLRIEGPACPSCSYSNVEFPVFSAQTGEQVGLITKQWAGFVQEVKKNYQLSPFH